MELLRQLNDAGKEIPESPVPPAELAALVAKVERGEINASTGMETTTYYARVLKGDWALALDILADILTDSLYEEDELERERHVILQEIAGFIRH